MKNPKERTAIWLYPETMNRLDGWLEKDNCKSRSEFVEKALSFYMGYLGTEDTSSYLSKALLTSIQGTLRTAENRMASNLFRLTVEISMMMHLLATTLDITDEELRRLRGRCVEDVKRTKGKIKLEDAVEFQSRPDEDEK
jgi:metal-responsive CopG/Arc/MetJ family transcriptional regulator